MRKTFICTKEEPLHKQISPKESLLIEELEVKGYLDGDDYELLTEMSGEKGRLKSLAETSWMASFTGYPYAIVLSDLLHACLFLRSEPHLLFPSQS